MVNSSDSLLFLETCWEYFVLGVVQGLTEFLPISSTAHLKVIPMLLGWGDPGISVTAALQLGSTIAVIGYFRQDLKKTFKGIILAVKRAEWEEPYARLGVSICLGTIPILIIGFLIKNLWPDYENSGLRSIPMIAIVSIVMALLLSYAERQNKQRKFLDNVSTKDGWIVGLSQVFSLIPGVSRSGITLTTSLLRGLTRKDAARFAFLLGIPAISFSGLAEFKDALKSANNLNVTFGSMPLIIGIITAMAVSWISIDWFLSYLKNNNTWIFIIYRMVFGLLLLGWWSMASSI